MSLNGDVRKLLLEISECNIPGNLLEKVLGAISLIDESEPKTAQDGMNLLNAAVIELGRMQNPDIDAIIPLVEKGMLGYGVCMERANKVDEYLLRISQ
jgi:hypothetical protein